MPDFTDWFEDELSKVSHVITDEITLLKPNPIDNIPFQAPFDSTYRGQELGLVVDIQGHNFQAYEDRVPLMVLGDKVLYKGITYEIIQIEPDGTGWQVYVVRRD